MRGDLLLNYVYTQANFERIQKKTAHAETELPD